MVPGVLTYLWGSRVLYTLHRLRAQQQKFKGTGSGAFVGMFDCTQGNMCLAFKRAIVDGTLYSLLSFGDVIFALTYVGSWKPCSEAP